MANFIGAPSLVDEQDAFRDVYPARVHEFTEAGRQVQLAPASSDREKIAILLVDYQHDFVDPTGTLSVPGAREDVARFLSWFYANAPTITSIYASLDTHLPYQIFFSAWWHDPHTGEHPQPFTAISAADVNDRRWVPLFHSEWSIYYVNKLAKQARKDLMIWPYHTMQGTLGQSLVAALSEAIAWHSAARGTQPIYLPKGLTTRSEYYGIFGAEVYDPTDPTSSVNTSLLDAVIQHDRVYIAGEARSHCVLETLRQLTTHLSQQPALLGRLHLLSDCTSSVQHPTMDFDAMANQELELMQKQGMQLVKSSDKV
ncbi:MAG TPA: cysteine hydrolase family protein [Ktedonobacteraceae bacterium]